MVGRVGTEKCNTYLLVIPMPSGEKPSNIAIILICNISTEK